MYTGPTKEIMMPTTTKTTSKNETSSNRLTNYMEELTADILGEMLIKERSESFSDRAIQDIKALALNRLWPMYTTTMTGKDFLRKIVVEDKVERDIVRELRAAMDIVRTNPRA
jgi:hypothetical protein